MSGGSLDYFYSSLEDKVGCFKDKELDDLVKDLAKLFYEYEWYMSGDTNKGIWTEARNAFKKKWFGENSRQERVEQYLEEIKHEVLDSFGLSNRYCKNCKYWEPEEDGKYGDCKEPESPYKHCLMHRSEGCEKFEELE